MGVSQEGRGDYQEIQDREKWGAIRVGWRPLGYIVICEGYVWLVAKSYLALCNTMDCNLLGSSVHFCFSQFCFMLWPGKPFRKQFWDLNFFGYFFIPTQTEHWVNWTLGVLDFVLFYSKVPLEWTILSTSKDPQSSYYNAKLSTVKLFI